MDNAKKNILAKFKFKLLLFYTPSSCGGWYSETVRNKIYCDYLSLNLTKMCNFL